MLCRRGRFRPPIGYSCAGTVEFLLDEDGQLRLHRDESADSGRAHRDRGDHRRRPGSSQLRIAAGETLEDLGLTAGGIGRRAPHCSAGSPPRIRPTASGPTPAGSPRYRSPGGAGIRLDGGTNLAPRSARTSTRMLVKLTCRGRDFPDRGGPGAPGDRGVPDPRGVDQHPVPAGGARRPRLPGRPRHDVVHRRAPAAADPRASADRGTKILNYLADVTVNKPHGTRPSRSYPHDKLPAVDLGRHRRPGPGSG